MKTGVRKTRNRSWQRRADEYPRHSESEGPVT